MCTNLLVDTVLPNYDHVNWSGGCSDDAGQSRNYPIASIRNNHNQQVGVRHGSDLSTRIVTASNFRLHFYFSCLVLLSERFLFRRVSKTRIDETWIVFALFLYLSCNHFVTAPFFIFFLHLTLFIFVVFFPAIVLVVPTISGL